MKTSITVKHQVIIHADRMNVWSFTQDFSKRQMWDKSILHLEVLQTKPFKRVRLKTKGGVETTLEYKLCRKPEKTSLRMINTKSLLIAGGGGSWTYRDVGGHTEWTQINTLVLRHSSLYLLFGWIIRRQLIQSTMESMQRAGTLIETEYI